MSTIQLGAPGALRKYPVKARGDGLLWGRGPAQPFSAKVNTSNPYDEVDIWNEWVQTDWQPGVGRVVPEEGGFLFGETDSRVPKQLILPPLLCQTDQRTVNGTPADCRYMPETMAGNEVTVGPSAAVRRIAVQFTTPAFVDLESAEFLTKQGFFFYGKVPNGVEVRIAVYSNSAGAPNASVVADTFTAYETAPTYYWWGVQLASASLAESTTYWMIVEVVTAGETISVATGNSGYTVASQTYNGTTWAALTGKYLCYTTDIHTTNIGGFTAGGSAAGSIIRRFNDALYFARGSWVWKYNTTNSAWEYTSAIAGGDNIISAEVFGPRLYLGTNTGNYGYLDTLDAITSIGSGAHILLEYQGLLYRVDEYELYYSANPDGGWTGPYAVGSSAFRITGMAGLGDSLYLANAKALYRFAPGDVVEEVLRWGAEDDANGLGMLTWKGSIYIPLADRIMQMTADGQIQDVWISTEGDLPYERLGRIDFLFGSNNWLLNYINSRGLVPRPMVLAYQEEGWHTLATLPNEPNPVTTESNLVTYYDRGTGRLWIACSVLGPMYIDLPDYAINPYNDTASRYMPYAWVEWDKFFGGQILLNKDFESVIISGDGLDATGYIQVYWQDEGSTDWELHGTIDSDGKELRWTDYATRPAGKWVKLGLLLVSTDGTATPRVRAVVVKFLPMVNDRFRDTITLTLADYITFPDGTQSTYTRAQQWSHLDSMIRRVIPFIYQDPLGDQYEVKVVDWSCNVPLYNTDTGSGVVREQEVVLVLEQTPNAGYTP